MRLKPWRCSNDKTSGLLPHVYLIKNALIVTLDSQRRILRDGAIAIEGNKIVSIGKSEDFIQRYVAEETIDAKDYVVLSGFIDSYTHVSAEQLVRGFIPDNVYATEWIFNWALLIYASVTEEDEYYSSLFSFIECLKTGTTT